MGISQHGQTFICERFYVVFQLPFLLVHKYVPAVFPLSYGGSFI